MSVAKLDGGRTTGLKPTATERPVGLDGGRTTGLKPTTTGRSVRQTRIFGIPVGLDPKILVGAIVLVALILFWYNSRGDDEGSATTSVARPQHVAAPVTLPKSHIASMRRSTQANDRGTLRLKPVDATRGDIDPTLRLDLLTRLQSVEAAPGGRNLFEVGASPAQIAANAPPIVGPKVVPASPLGAAAPIPAGPPPLQIPLKFYGFVKPADKRDTPRGFFMDGDNVLVATEGQLLKQKYLVVSLNATGARVEDVQLKQGQTLPVEAEAVAQ